MNDPLTDKIHAAHLWLWFTALVVAVFILEYEEPKVITKAEWKPVTNYYDYQQFVEENK